METTLEKIDRNTRTTAPKPKITYHWKPDEKPEPRDFFDAMMRDDESVDDMVCDEPNLLATIQKFLALAAIGLLLYGLALGTIIQLAQPLTFANFAVTGTPMIWVPLALTGGFLAAIAIGLPSFYFYTQLAALFPLHTILWPFFAPVLLGRAVDRGDPDSHTERARLTTSRPVADPRIRDAEAQLLSALNRVGGIAEELLGPEMESVRNLSDSLGRMDARLTEMDALLSSREFDRDQAEQALHELLESPDIEANDARVESVQARLRNIERLHTMRERARRDLQRAILKMEEMNSQILLLQFADRPEGEIADSIHDIAATIDGLSEGLLVV